MALESGKLNHLIKDVIQRGRGSTKRRDRRKDKIINMIRSWPDDRKRKLVERDESWMKAPIVFPPLSMEEASDEPLIIEAVMEGYLVHRVYVDHGASVEHAHLVENLVVNCCLSSTHPSMLPYKRFSNHPLALLSRVCWNIRHHTGMGHSPEFAADENRLRWSSGSVVPSYNLMFAGILNSG
nr:reverse transcriptase domain-containing protein [Tanacetum cinerariifolium]GFC27697.1 reverse transcriptase domain-containing protein [Tanacetum cinerariifolium]